MVVLLIPSSAGPGLGQVQCLALKILPTVAPVYGVFTLYRYEGKGQNDKNGFFATISICFCFIEVDQALRLFNPLGWSLADPLMKFIRLFITYLVILPGLLIVAGETALRLKGFKPWQPLSLTIKVTPGDKLYVKHPALGYANKPGEFTVTEEDGYSFKLTILPDGCRITHPLGTYKEAGTKEEIWILGCSFTTGWSLNDSETFPWLLQERFPMYEVINFGVNGYGTVQSLIQFRQALQERRVPKIVVYAYAGFHVERNVYSRSWRKVIRFFSNLGQQMVPYARLGAGGELRYYLGNVEYNEFPLMRHSALMHFIEQKYDKLEENYYHSREVTEALILEMAKVAKEKGITFVLAGITDSQGTRKMLSFARKRGIKAIDISVDLDTTGYRNSPYDIHPSALADRKYADKLEAFLRRDGLL